MLSFIVARYWLLLQLALLSRAKRPSVTDNRAHVTYVGTATTDGAIEEFLSVRYGLDTGGEQRFRVPIPYSPKEGEVIDATNPGAACPQPDKPVVHAPSLGYPNISEDCLNLRICRPAKPTKKLPVLVWIHGGGHMIGSVYDSVYDPVGLVRQSVEDGNPIIYVAMNFRLNIFGFPSTKHLLQEGSLNLGLRDQALALEWVKEHISAFGGDPDRITLFGQDTGASDIGLHLLKGQDEHKKAPFQRVISQSGSALSVWVGGAENTRTSFIAVAKKFGCVIANPDFWFTVNCLRQVGADNITKVAFDVALGFNPNNGFNTFGPVIDGDIIPEQPLKAFEDGRFVQGLDVLFGWTLDEGSVLVPTTIKTTIDAVTWLAQRYPDTLDFYSALELMYIYLDGPYVARGECDESVSTAWCALSRLIRDVTYACPSLKQAAHQSMTGSSSIFMYELNQTANAEQMLKSGQQYLGVPHFADVPYVFNNLHASYSIDDERHLSLSSWMSSAWARFATLGSPSAEQNSARWPTSFGQVWAADEPRQIMIRTIGGPKSGPRQLSFLERRNCEAVNRLLAKSAQY